MGVDVRFLGFILTQWGMQFFIVFQCFSLFLHLQWFGVIIDLLHFFPVWWASPSVFLWISMCICGALQSSTVYLCAGGQRWQCLGGRLHGKLPGWQCQRGLRWHLPDEIRCPGCPPVDVPARWWGQWRCSGPSGGRGATSFSNLFHGEKTWKNFRSSCEVHVLSQVECHHIQMDQSVGCTYKVDICRYLVFVGSLTDAFWHLWTRFAINQAKSTE